MSFVQNTDLTNVRISVCNNVYFFSSPETGLKWIARHAGTIFYPVKEVYQALKDIHQNKYNDIIAPTKQEKRMCC
jgi:hypothetical protein